LSAAPLFRQANSGNLKALEIAAAPVRLGRDFSLQV
jgi:hypothetical protein